MSLCVLSLFRPLAKDCSPHMFPFSPTVAMVHFALLERPKHFRSPGTSTCCRSLQGSASESRPAPLERSSRAIGITAATAITVLLQASNVNAQEENMQHVFAEELAARVRAMPGEQLRFNVGFLSEDVQPCSALNAGDEQVRFFKRILDSADGRFALQEAPDADVILPPATSKSLTASPEEGAPGTEEEDSDGGGGEAPAATPYEDQPGLLGQLLSFVATGRGRAVVGGAVFAFATTATAIYLAVTGAMKERAVVVRRRDATDGDEGAEANDEGQKIGQEPEDEAGDDAGSFLRQMFRAARGKGNVLWERSEPRNDAPGKQDGKASAGELDRGRGQGGTRNGYEYRERPRAEEGGGDNNDDDDDDDDRGLPIELMERRDREEVLADNVEDLRWPMNQPK